MSDSDPGPRTGRPDPLLAIVPARAGSRGLRGKNLRSVAGRPLIAHTIDAARRSGVVDRLVVSTDDPRVRNWAMAHDVEVVERPAALAADAATIADVAHHVATTLDWNGCVAVLQPTSPLRSADAIRDAVAAFHPDVDSLATVVRESHLFWQDVGPTLDDAQPLFTERVNRQLSPARVLRETGGIQLIRSERIRERPDMVTDRHRLFLLDEREGLDIDTIDDFARAQRDLESGLVVFRFMANRTVGSGHLFHSLQIAEELADQQVEFLLRHCDSFASEMLDRLGHSWREETDLGADLAAMSTSSARVLVNDVLDTDLSEVRLAKQAHWTVVNVEDLGPGAAEADWVVNALYPPPSPTGEWADVAAGPRYATLRTEFRALPDPVTRPVAERILVTFGGTDPGHLAARFASVLVKHVMCDIVVVRGPGTPDTELPDEVTVLDGVESMAAEMRAADLILTSAGRTVFEAAATGTPVIVVAQNAREASHTHLGFDNGVVFLGLAPLVEDEHVASVVGRLLNDANMRSDLSTRLRASVDDRGAERIAERIRRMIRGL